MAGGRTNTERIEILESQAANLSARLDVQDIVLKGIDELLRKSVTAAEGNNSKITVIEERLLVLVDLKGSLSTIASLEKDFVAVRKDLESLQKWKDELKKERDEAGRRLWAFGPNPLAAVVSGVISLGITLLVVWLNRSR
jgi:hypothetical protein